MDNVLDGLPRLIRELIENDIPVTLSKDGYILEGWYEHGKVTLNSKRSTVEQGTTIWTLTSRYGQIGSCSIYSLGNLVSLHFGVWQIYQDRCNDWKQPQKLWIPLMVKFGCIEEIITKYWQPKRRS